MRIQNQFAFNPTNSRHTCRHCRISRWRKKQMTTITMVLIGNSGLPWRKISVRLQSSCLILFLQNSGQASLQACEAPFGRPCPNQRRWIWRRCMGSLLLSIRLMSGLFRETLLARFPALICLSRKVAMGRGPWSVFWRHIACMIVWWAIVKVWPFWSVLYWWM